MYFGFLIKIRKPHTLKDEKEKVWEPERPRAETGQREKERGELGEAGSSGSIIKVKT